ncbi:MAG: hypothetical protein QXY18_05760 [Nitrososphaerota archaeon]
MINEYDRQKLILHKEMDELLIERYKLLERKQILEELKKGIMMLNEENKRKAAIGMEDIRNYDGDIKGLDIAIKQLEEEINNVNTKIMKLGMDLDKLEKSKYVKSEEEYLEEMAKMLEQIKKDMEITKKKWKPLRISGKL